MIQLCASEYVNQISFIFIAPDECLSVLHKLYNIR